MSRNGGVPTSPAETEEAPTDNVAGVRQYALYGAPLEREICVDMMRHPDDLARAVSKLSMLAEKVSASEVSDISPGVQGRLDVLRKLVAASYDRGYGTEDSYFQGGTSSNASIVRRSSTPRTPE